MMGFDEFFRMNRRAATSSFSEHLDRSSAGVSSRWQDEDRAAGVGFAFDFGY